MKALILFILLQAADFATTVAAINFGGAEQNPLVAHMMGFGGINGLLLAKVIALAIGGAAAAAGKNRGIRVANFAFAAIVVWNLSIISRLLIA